MSDEPTTRTPLVYVALIKAQRAVDGVTKDRVNKDQGFKFRSIDEIYNMLHGVLATAGLVTIPRVLERIDGERATRNGGSMAHVKLKVEYDFLAEDGSKHTVGPIWGEALDTSDKASNKALAFAHKYAMLQTFTIPTEDTRETPEERDADHRTTETTGPIQGAPAQGDPSQAPPAHVIMVQRYGAIGVSRANIEARWKKRVEDFGEKELDEARELYKIICEEPKRRAEFFEPGARPQPPPQRPQANPGQRLNQRGGAR